MNLVKFLNDNQGAFSVVFSAVVMVATVVYAKLTAVLVAETRRMRQVQTEPFLEITAESTEEAINLFRLRIRNVGLGGARDIRFVLTASTGGEAAATMLKDFGDTLFLQQGLAYLGPGESRFSSYTSMHEDGDAKLASILHAVVHYRSVTGERYQHAYVLDMSERKGDYRLGTPPLQSIAKNLEQLQRDFRNLATGFHRPKVITFSSADRQAEREQDAVRYGGRQPVRRLRRNRS